MNCLSGVPVPPSLYKSYHIGCCPSKGGLGSRSVEFFGSVIDLHVIGVGFTPDEIYDLYKGETKLLDKAIFIWMLKVIHLLLLFLFFLRYAVLIHLPNYQWKSCGFVPKYYGNMIIASKTNVITTANQMKGRYCGQPRRTQSKNTQTASRENVGDQVVIGFSFESDWLKTWCKLTGPVTLQSKAKHTQS